MDLSSIGAEPDPIDGLLRVNLALIATIASESQTATMLVMVEVLPNCGPALGINT